MQYLISVFLPFKFESWLWPSTIPHKTKLSIIGIRALVLNFKQNKENGRFARRHVQAHQRQVLSVEVEDEGHVGGKRSLVVGAIRSWKYGQDRCTNVEGGAYEDNGIHTMLHRH